MAARKNIINLLPQEEFEASTVGRILKWALSTFRIIVIVTEMFVMLAFLSRFWLDARNSDLNELITQKQAVIAAEADFEDSFRRAQKRLSVFSAMTSEGLVSASLGEISSYLPGDVFLTSVSTTQNSIQIKGVSVSEMAIAQFISNLESSTMFDEIELNQVGSGGDNEALLAFTLKMTVKEGRVE